MMEVPTDEINPMIIRMLPEDLVRRHRVIPLKIDENHLEVALVNPDDVEVIDEIKLITGLDVRPVVMGESQIVSAIEKYYGIGEATKQSIIDLRVEGLKASSEKKKILVLEPEDTTQMEDLPVVKLFNSIIEGAIVAKASDIHLEPQEPEMRVS